MAESGTCEYTLKIAGKRQVTLPKEIVTALKLEKGDEFQIIVHNPSDIRLVPYTRVRKDLITPEIEQILQQRRKEVDKGAVVSLESVLKKAAVKNVRRRGGFGASAAAKGRPVQKSRMGARLATS